MSITLDLLSMAKLNTAMKKILKSSEQINMIALNAMFLSKKNKTNEMAGFITVTTELRNFSPRLDEAIVSLMQLTDEMVRNVAIASILQNRAALLSKTFKACNIDAALFLYKPRIKEQQILLQLKQYQLAHKLQQTMKLVDTGMNLILLARIEAANKGELTKRLMGVAEQLEYTMVIIYGNVKYSQGLLEL